ncbi:MAG: pyruvate kinase, partial [Firmicutes bacterium]|nr:pyruvate kinase [Bacillota bacterium]
MRRTKLVCTMGPSCEEETQIRGLIEAGMSVARFNFSHGTHEEHRLRMERVRRVAEAMHCPIALMLDTKGPEIRTGLLEGKQVTLQEGAPVVLTGEQKVGNAQEISVSYATLADDLHPGDHLLIDDGLIDLEVLRLEGQRIYCIVRVGGVLGEQKGVNVPSAALHLPSLTEKDVDDLRFGVEMGVDFIAASFVRQARDVFAIRRLLEELKSPAQIIAKIENLEGFEHLDEILAVADGLMVARGDLGVEVPAEDVPIMQKEMITKCNRAGKPVITATQMLDSMQRNPRPTRAEASDVANAIFDGTDATMLSGESAAGKYPVESARTMMRIAQRAEEAYFGGQVHVPQRIPDTSPDSTTEAIGRAV